MGYPVGRPIYRPRKISPVLHARVCFTRCTAIKSPGVHWSRCPCRVKQEVDEVQREVGESLVDGLKVPSVPKADRRNAWPFSAVSHRKVVEVSTRLPIRKCAMCATASALW